MTTRPGGTIFSRSAKRHCTPIQASVATVVRRSLRSRSDFRASPSAATTTRPRTTPRGVPDCSSFTARVAGDTSDSPKESGRGTMRAVVSDRKEAPAAIASRTSAASSADREIDTPPSCLRFSARPAPAKFVFLDRSDRERFDQWPQTRRRQHGQRVPTETAAADLVAREAPGFNKQDQASRDGQLPRQERPRRAGSDHDGVPIDRGRVLNGDSGGEVQFRSQRSRNRSGQCRVRRAPVSPARSANARLSASVNAPSTERGPSTCTIVERVKARHPHHANQ